MEIASTMIWIWITDSISYDDNRYAKNASKIPALSVYGGVKYESFCWIIIPGSILQKWRHEG